MTNHIPDSVPTTPTSTRREQLAPFAGYGQVVNPYGEPPKPDIGFLNILGATAADAFVAAHRAGKASDPGFQYWVGGGRRLI